MKSVKCIAISSITKSCAKPNIIFNSLAKFNIGRIAAVLGYCYHLCKKYISQYFNSYGLLSFLGVIAGFLIQFFIKQKFYDWLKGIGGWVSGNDVSYSFHSSFPGSASTVSSC